MTFAWWSHYFAYSTLVPFSKAEAIEKLADLYRQRTRQRLEVHPEQGALLVEKGSLIASAIGVGPETWCRHIIKVTATHITPSETQLEFSLHLKLIGWTLGKNFLLEECKRAVASMGAGKWN